MHAWLLQSQFEEARTSFHSPAYHPRRAASPEFATSTIINFHSTSILSYAIFIVPDFSLPAAAAAQLASETATAKYRRMIMSTEVPDEAEAVQHNIT